MKELQFSIVKVNKHSHKLNYHLDNLIHNRTLGVYIPKFYSPQECDTIVNRCFAHGFYWFEENVRGRIGANLAQFQGIEKGKERYFQAVNQYQPLRDWIFYETSDPTIHIMKLFESLGSVKIASDKKFNESYSSGMIHIQQNATQLHVDRVWDEAPDWSISRLTKQFSSVLYLQTPENGGEVAIYNRKWQKSDIQFNRADTATMRRGVTLGLVDEVEKLSFTPRQGDLLLFSSELYHQIKASTGDKLRISAMCFFGINEDNELEFFM